MKGRAKELKIEAPDQNSVTALFQGCVCQQAEHMTQEDSQGLPRRLTTNKGVWLPFPEIKIDMTRVPLSGDNCLSSLLAGKGGI